MRRAAMLLALALLAACSGPEKEPEKVEVARPTDPHAAYALRPYGYDDATGELEAWRTAVVARSGSTMRGAIHHEIQARLTADRDRLAELSRHPAGITVERRIELLQKIAFSEAQLRLLAVPK